jgi:hypothetical protein
MILYYELKTVNGHGVPKEGVQFPNIEIALEAAIDYWGADYTDIHFDKKWYMCDNSYENKNLTTKFTHVLAKTKEDTLVCIGFLYAIEEITKY